MKVSALKVRALPVLIGSLLFVSATVVAATAAPHPAQVSKTTEKAHRALPVGVTAAPTLQTISGTPLRIIIGSDTSFQVINSSFPGQGQIYPSGCTTDVADAGIFAAIGATLFSADFDLHTCSTATSSLGAYTPWTPVSMSAVSGSGTGASPFQVTVVADAGATGVRLTAVYTYVNSDSFFRIAKTFSATSAATMNIYLGADIYLAGSDDGFPFLEPTSSSPGGKDCPTSSYIVLLVPTTVADRYAARNFDTVWGEIGTHGDLTNLVDSALCDDNGAALQWRRTLAAGGSTTITSAVSFGAIPLIAQFRVDTVTPNQGNQGQTLTVTVSGIGFQSGTTFNFGPGISVTSTTINSSTQATVTIVIAPAATPGFRDVTGTQSSGGLTSTATSAFEVLGAASGADVSITKTANATTAAQGTLVTFTLAVSNAGPAGATGVAVTDSLPAGLTLQSASASQGTCVTTGNSVTCQVGSLAAGASSSITLVTLATGTPGTVTNTATVSSTSADPNAANNTSSAAVGIAPGAPSAPASGPALGPLGLGLLAALLGLAGFLFISSRH